MVFGDFTLLRPAWLLLLPWVVWFVWQQRQRSTLQWQAHIDPALLRPLVRAQRNRWGYWLNQLSRAGLLLLPIALAGPALQRPMDNALTERPLIFVFDQSLSMLSEDLPPDRHTRARQKIQDVLRAHPERPAGLVAYSGSAHLVAPLTFDHNALISLLQQLHPIIMPIPGSEPVAAMELAVAQLNALSGDILWLTDDLRPEQRLRFPALTHTGQQLGIIALGTSEGAPVRLTDDRFLRDYSGQLIVPGLDVQELATLADRERVRWATLSVGDTDWQQVLSPLAGTTTAAVEEDLTVTVDLGYGLLLFALPGLLMWFRSGQLASIALLALLACGIGLGLPTPALAQPTIGENQQPNLSWTDWFRSPDQQGYARLPERPDLALQLFRSREWKAYAALEAEHYQLAAELLVDAEHPREQYHRGNALVHLERYEEALEEYRAALKSDPEFTPAAENLALVEAFLRQPPPPESETGQQAPRNGPPGTGENSPQPRSAMPEQDSPGEADPGSDGADQNAQILEDSIRRRLPEPDATFLQRKFQYQFESNPDIQNPTGPPW